MWTHRPGSASNAVDCWTLSSSDPDALLLLDRNTRWINLLLERGGPLELLPGPEFYCRQPKRQTLARHRQARVHQDAADRVRSQATGLVPAAVDALGDPDRLCVLSLKAELGGVMEHKNRAIGRNRALKGRLKMTGENVRLADPVVEKKRYAALVLAQSWHTRGMLWPMALPICATSLRSRLFRRSSTKLSQQARDQTMRRLPRPSAPLLPRIGARQGTTVDSCDATLCALLRPFC